IMRVVQQASKARTVSRVVVATDDERILQHVKNAGAETLLTRSDHQSGTDRCAEVAERLGFEGIVVNVQGDEPFIQPDQIDALVAHLHANATPGIATLARKIDVSSKIFDPNIVKVVFSQSQQALYFSRHPIPFVRNAATKDWIEKTDFYKHIGLYAYHASVLRKLAHLPKGRLEINESLEQLRWLEYGYPIAVCLTDIEAIGIDTPADLDYVRALLDKGKL
ncbi:MAG: 3-deoxy-manno-octulosonate cytidylyltransferase, partial [Bacteroidota bacterium]